MSGGAFALVALRKMEAGASHKAGFNLLTNSAIDQHLLARHRESDLIPVIAAHPNLLGIGLDQSTAIVVHGNSFQVIGASKVAIYDNRMRDHKKYYFSLSRPAIQSSRSQNAVAPAQDRTKHL